MRPVGQSGAAIRLVLAHQMFLAKKIKLKCEVKGIAVYVCLVFL